MLSRSLVIPRASGRMLSSSTVASRRRMVHIVRAMSSKNGKGDDKSWTEIASEAADVGKDILKKVTGSLGSLTGLGKKEAEVYPPRDDREDGLNRRSPRAGPLYREPNSLPEALGQQLGSVVGNMLGQAVGGLIGIAAKGLQEAARQSASVYDEATAVVKSSGALRKRLGSAIECSSPYSTSSSSTYINGKSSKQVSLAFVASGSSGATAEVQVSATEDDSGVSDMRIVARLPTGEVVNVDGTGGGAGGSKSGVIDVEYKDVNSRNSKW